MRTVRAALLALLTLCASLAALQHEPRVIESSISPTCNSASVMEVAACEERFEAFAQALVPRAMLDQMSGYLVGPEFDDTYTAGPHGAGPLALSGSHTWHHNALAAFGISDAEADCGAPPSNPCAILFAAPVGTTAVINLQVLGQSPGVYWPGAVYGYIPPGTVLSGMVALSGGSGTAAQFCQSLYICLTSSQYNFAFLTNYKLAIFFPEPQASNGQSSTCTEGSNPAPIAPTATTWCNRSMTSANNDKLMLQQLADYIKTTYNVSVVSAVAHSQGAMMLKRMWCESNGTFNAVSGYSGPFNNYWATNACVADTQLTFPSVTGRFDGGEPITQATSGAAGVISGVSTNGKTITISGVGATPFDTSHVVTGTYSGATATANATASAKYPASQLLVGLLDNVLDVSDGPAGPGSHWTDTTLTQNASQYSAADIVRPIIWWGLTYSECYVANTRAGSSVCSGSQLPDYTGTICGGTFGAGVGSVVCSVTINGNTFAFSGQEILWNYSSQCVQIALLTAGTHQVSQLEQTIHQRLLQNVTAPWLASISC